MADRSKAADPARLTPEALAALLTRSGEQEITEEDIGADIRAGAPTNTDGTLSLVLYSAWLAGESP